MKIVYTLKAYVFNSSNYINLHNDIIKKDFVIKWDKKEIFDTLFIPLLYALFLYIFLIITYTQHQTLHEKTSLQIFTLVVKVSKGIIKIRLNFTSTLLNIKLLFTLHLLRYKETG